MALYTTYFDFQPGRQGGSRRTDRTAQAKKLVAMFIANFEKVLDHVDPEVKAAAPKTG